MAGIDTAVVTLVPETGTVRCWTGWNQLEITIFPAVPETGTASFRGGGQSAQDVPHTNRVTADRQGDLMHFAASSESSDSAETHSHSGGILLCMIITVRSN